MCCTAAAAMLQFLDRYVWLASGPLKKVKLGSEIV
jgi:hypothetical protein